MVNGNNNFWSSLLFPVLIVWFCSCGQALIPFDENVPAHSLSYIGGPPIEDARIRFREIFCELLNEEQRRLDLEMRCTEFLWKLNDEPQIDIKKQKRPKRLQN